MYIQGPALSNKIIFPFSSNSEIPKPISFDEVWMYGYKKDNKDYIDLSLGSCGCFPLGFVNPEFINTVSKELSKFPFISGDFKTSNRYVDLLSEKFYDLSNGYYSIFSLSGSDAVETALRVCHLYNKESGYNKYIKVGMKDSYHGSTYLSSSVSGSTYIHDMFGRDKNCVTTDWDLDSIEKQLSDEVECIIIETCSWQSGLYDQSEEWWTRVRNLCDKHNILLIIDDVAFSGGKTGQFFGYKSYMKPDIICFGKAVSGGFFPLSGCLISQRIHDCIKDAYFLHGFSYSFNMPGIISSLKYLEILEKNQVFDNFSNVRNKSFNAINVKGVKEIRSYGTMFCLDLESNQSSNLFETFLECGIYLGLWNITMHNNRLLIQCPVQVDESYLLMLNQRLNLAMKKIIN
jgi:putrescine---pyruvate transaminase